MTVRHTMHAQLARPTQRIRDLLELLAGLRSIDQPLTTADGLRASLELLLRLAEFVGIEPSWTDRIRQILNDPRVFELVLAVVRYLDGFVNAAAPNDGVSAAASTGEQTAQPRDINTSEINTSDIGDSTINDSIIATVDAQAFIDWLPIVVQILSLLNKLRGVA